MNGRSKGKRLPCFLQAAGTPTVVRTLKALWEYREAVRARVKQAETLENAEGRLLALINRLEGKPETAKPAGQAPVPAFDRPRLLQLKADLLALHQLAPQARGYAFEKLLCDIFKVYGLEAREPFRLRGEQIDGSFQLLNETYLFEAKWQANKPASQICTRSTANWNRRLRGRVDYSSATADSPRTGLQPSAGASG